jgi:DNA-binding NarL/FixJ family response regulator
MNKLRILIAEDNQEMRWAIIRMLAGEFEVVGSTSDGRNLIDSTLTLAPDIVVTDVSMPFLTGPEAMEILRATGLDIPFVFVSADTDGVEFYIEAGALGFVHKPDMARELARAIAAAGRGNVYVSRGALREVSVPRSELRR